MELEYKITTTKIDYCVEDEDVCEKIDRDVTIEPDSEEYYDAIDEEIKRVKASLSQHLELEITCDPEDLDDMVCDAISNETGWLVNSFEYDIIHILGINKDYTINTCLSKIKCADCGHRRKDSERGGEFACFLNEDLRGPARNRYLQRLLVGIRTGEVKEPPFGERII